MMPSIQNLAGPKPVELFAAIEQDLQGANGEAQGSEAEPSPALHRRSGRCREESRDAEEGESSVGRLI